MSEIRLDHFITGVDAEDIDVYLEGYGNVGFLVAERTVKHNPGLRDGFTFAITRKPVCEWLEERMRLRVRGWS